MTLLGKIFTMLIFVLSLVFMTISVMVYATQKNWRNVVLNPRPGEAGYDEKYDTGLKYQLQDLRDTADRLRSELQQMESQTQMERAARRETLQRLQTQLASARTELQAKESEFQSKLADKIAIDQELGVANERLTALTNEVQTLRDENRQVREDRDDQFEQVVELASNLHNVEGMLRTLEERRDQLALQYTEMKRQMDARGISVSDPIDNIPPRDLDGVVTKISTKNQYYIEISLGSDDGIRVGHQLDVYRNNSYLGKVIIRFTDYNHAVAEIIKDYQKGQVKEGDSVTTRFS